MAFCRDSQDISTIILTGEGDKAFCSGGDQNVKNIAGYIGKDGVPRLNVLDLQKMIRSIPKPVVAMVNGYAIGGVITSYSIHYTKLYDTPSPTNSIFTCLHSNELSVNSSSSNLFPCFCMKFGISTSQPDFVHFDLDEA